MLKDKMKLAGSFLLKNSKLVLPVGLILAVAVTVSVALKANDSRAQEDTFALNLETSAVQTTQTPGEVIPESVKEDIPLEENTNNELYTLICTYYTAYAYGDVDTIKSISNYLGETDEIRIKAMSEYVESYPTVKIYTKPGPVADSYLAYVYYQMTVKNFEEAMSGMETFYVCTNEDGTLYLNEGEVSEEELEYIRQVNLQDDVAELYNRVNVECNDTFLNNTELFYYVQEIVNEVQKSTGEVLAAQVSDGTEGIEGTGETEGEAETGNEGTTPVTETPAPTEIPVQAENAGPVYAKATTTVNVRVSDSEQADKAGKVAGGTKVEVLEQQVNGWTRVRTEDLEGYIKSEYLQLMDTANSADSIGTVTATSNVNVRTSASETAERLGILAGGETVDLLARENGWCKINYNGQVGYVKEDYVQ